MQRCPSCMSRSGFKNKSALHQPASFIEGNHCCLTGDLSIISSGSYLELAPTATESSSLIDGITFIAPGGTLK